MSWKCPSTTRIVCPAVNTPSRCGNGHADLAVIVTEWNQFGALDHTRVASMLADKVLVDLRNVNSA